MSKLLDVQGLIASYGKIAAVNGVDLNVQRGGVVSVVGPNGAGKTTMLNALMGLMPARGQVRLDGRRIDHLPTEARLEAGLCLVAETRELFASMSVEDNLQLGGFARRREGRVALANALDAVYEVSPPARTTWSDRRHIVRGRTADAGAGQGADVKTANADAR